MLEKISNNSPKLQLREFGITCSRTTDLRFVKNSKIVHVSSSKRRIGCRNTRPRQQCITCLDSRTVSRTCIPDRYVTQSEFDKKQISNSLRWIQPSSDAIRQPREIGREPIFLRRKKIFPTIESARSIPFYVISVYF